MTTCLLAVDQGTSSTKALVFSAEGVPLAAASRDLTTRYTADGRAEQDPEEIYLSVIGAVADVLALLEHDKGIARTQIACAGIANQRETVIVWDFAGKPLYPAVVWQCKRSVAICNELSEAGAGPEIRDRTGLIIDPYFSGTKLTWLVRNHESVKRSHENGEAMFGTVDSWILYRLTGGAVHATDTTNASRTLLFNIRTLQWDSELARLLEVPRLRAPVVQPSSHRYGESDFGGAFPRPIPITAMVGDSHSAFFGERCFVPGDAKATLGTGCSILLNAGQEAPPAHDSAVTTIGFSLPGRIDYALEGIIVSAGSIVTWLGRELGLFSTTADLDGIGATEPDSGGVAIVPAHAGMGAPFWQMDARGSIHGLTFGTTSRHLVRAALEAIPYQIRAILDAVRDESGIACKGIRADGGISRNAFVTQWIANTLGVPVRTCAIADVTALGAALLAGLALGAYGGIDDIAKLPIGEVVSKPNEQRSDADGAYRAWRQLVEKDLAHARE